MKYSRPKGETLIYLFNKKFSIKFNRDFRMFTSKEVMENFFFAGRCMYCKKVLKKECKEEIKCLKDFLVHLGDLEKVNSKWLVLDENELKEKKTCSKSSKKNPKKDSSKSSLNQEPSTPALSHLESILSTSSNNQINLFDEPSTCSFFDCSSNEEEMSNNIRHLAESVIENLDGVSQEALDAAIGLEVDSYLLKEFDLNEAIDVARSGKQMRPKSILLAESGRVAVRLDEIPKDPYNHDAEIQEKERVKSLKELKRLN